MSSSEVTFESIRPIVPLDGSDPRVLAFGFPQLTCSRSSTDPLSSQVQDVPPFFVTGADLAYLHMSIQR
jgi:hypothetical protein